MFRNVVAALNEALDITMHLKPLTEHFEVTIDVKKTLRSQKIFSRLLREQILLMSGHCFLQ